jgi:hypothetical protein
MCALAALELNLVARVRPDRVLPTKCAYFAEAGAVLRIETPGGGARKSY